ncbi:MAG: uridine diphosphate-N-acetylglucosamine-binding protein YvcK [Candidatus Acetothermia bacterium]
MKGKEMDWKGIFKWFYPGMKVKRWGLLVLLSAILFGFSILLLVGRDWVGLVYNTLLSQPAYYYLAASLGLLAGVIGLIWGVNRVTHSITTVIKPPSRSTSDIIWQSRLLDKGVKVVAVGGGTGLSVLLRGLKKHTANITAIVTVMDDGGSSGRLREEMNMLPPGDIRNCLIALADDESKMSRVFQHRFQDGAGLGGHSLGNLIIAGMEQIEGGFDLAIEETSNLLNIRGRVVPSTLKNTHIVATLEGGKVVTGESSLHKHPERIERITLAEPAAPYSQAVEAIEGADVIILGPGSLYTSIIPNMLVDGIPEAIEGSPATKYYVTNVMTEPGETDGMSARDHLGALNSYIDVSCLDYGIVNTGDVDRDILVRYVEEGSGLVEADLGSDNKYGLKLIEGDLIELVKLEGKQTVKHNHEHLATLILDSCQ